MLKDPIKEAKLQLWRHDQRRGLVTVILAQFNFYFNLLLVMTCFKLHWLQGRTKGNNQKGGPSKKTKTHAPAQHAQPEATPSQSEVTPATQLSVGSAEAMKIYCGIDPDELEILLNDDDILDIEPFNVDTSPVK